MQKFFLNIALCFLLFSLVFALTFDDNNSKWAFIHGNSSSGLIRNDTVYGELGVPAFNVTPGPRYSSMSFIDSNGNYMLFGGLFSVGQADKRYLNDLFKYSVTLKQWSWIHGSVEPNTLGTCDIVNVFSNNNIPGARKAGGVSYNGSNVMLFGGYGYSTNDGYFSRGNLNDIWTYNDETNQFTCRSHCDVINSAGVYKTYHEVNETSWPSSRYGSGCWSVGSNTMMIFGGAGIDSTGDILELDNKLNDLWEYNALTNIWVWLGGSKLKSNGGVYGNKGVFGASWPSSRYNAAWWKRENYVYMFGGYATCTSASGNSAYKNDLMVYDVNINQWALLSGGGCNVFPTYGTIHVFQSTLMPGSRYGSNLWHEFNEEGVLYLKVFGGLYKNTTLLDATTVTLNELWTYDSSNGYWRFDGGDVGGRLEQSSSTIYNDSVEEYHETNWPGVRYGSGFWVSDDTVTIYGGVQKYHDDMDSISPNIIYHWGDLWKWSIFTFSGETTTSAVSDYLPLISASGFIFFFFIVISFGYCCRQRGSTDNQSIYLFGALLGYLNVAFDLLFIVDMSSVSNTMYLLLAILGFSFVYDIIANIYLYNFISESNKDNESFKAWVQKSRCFLLLVFCLSFISSFWLFALISGAFGLSIFSIPMNDSSRKRIIYLASGSIIIHNIPCLLIYIFFIFENDVSYSHIVVTALIVTICMIVFPFFAYIINVMAFGADKDYGDEYEAKKRREARQNAKPNQGAVYDNRKMAPDVSWSLSDTEHTTSTTIPISSESIDKETKTDKDTIKDPLTKEVELF